MARRSRRLPLVVVVALALALTGVVTSLRRATNPATLPSGLAVLMNAESTALYCTGLSSGTGAPGRVVFYNTSRASRSLSVSVVSSSGATYSSTVEISGHESQSLAPATLVTGTQFAVAVQVSGGGVVGEEVSGSRRADVPCSSQGVTSWYAGGFDTLVGSSASLSVYNPTATAAVFNASLFSASGLSAPSSLQGYSVPAHTVSVIDLNGPLVNTANVGVAVSVLRGSLVIVGVEDSQGDLSYVQGATTTATTSWFPDVTTATSAVAEIRVSNPNDTVATVNVDVSLRHFSVPTQSTTIPAFSAGLVTVTPNSAIPAAGYAQVTVNATEPVVSTLATGTGSALQLVSAATPANAFLIRNFTGLGFDAASVTNTASNTISVSISSFTDGHGRATGALEGIKVSPGTSLDLAALMSSLRRSSNSTYIVTSKHSDMVVSLTLPSRPAGVNVMAPLDGR